MVIDSVQIPIFNAPLYPVALNVQIGVFRALKYPWPKWMIRPALVGVSLGDVKDHGKVQD